MLMWQSNMEFLSSRWHSTHDGAGTQALSSRLSDFGRPAAALTEGEIQQGGAQILLRSRVLEKHLPHSLMFHWGELVHVATFKHEADWDVQFSCASREERKMGAVCWGTAGKFYHRWPFCHQISVGSLFSVQNTHTLWPLSSFPGVLKVWLPMNQEGKPSTPVTLVPKIQRGG